MKSSTLLLLLGGAAFVAMTVKKQAVTSEQQNALITEDIIPLPVATSILKATNAEAALSLGNAYLDSQTLSPFAPNSPAFTEPKAYTPNPNAPVAHSTTVNPLDFKTYEEFFAAWFPTAFTKEWQDKYSGLVGATPQERDRNAQIAADYRHSLFNQASDIFMTSRRTMTQ